MENQNESIVELEEDTGNIHGSEDRPISNHDSPFGAESVDAFLKRMMGITRMCQKNSTDLQGWYHYSDYEGVKLTMNKINYCLTSLIYKIFSRHDIKLDFSGLSLSRKFDILRDGNDNLLDKVGLDLDEASGIRRDADLEMLDTTIRTIRAPISQSGGREMVLLAARNVEKPQLFFKVPINNSEKEPFIPSIKEKPNSKKPLALLLCVNSDGREYYPQPYEYELQHWTPNKKLLTRREPTTPPYPPDTPFLFVNTEDQLQIMTEELKKSKEIAVDVENHQFRSYQGLTCLIQISTRSKDYIIDTFPLREKLHVLNDSFTDPKITKVFHGADKDILWLQRDFSVYVVNMFDTHQASVILNYPHRSLAALLAKFCCINANKTYQRADWRIRPLPEDFIEYARQDSHYLLYIYDNLRNELIEKGNKLNNLLQATYSRSTEICLQRYEKPIIGPDSHLGLYHRSRKTFNSRQMFAFQQMFRWRDKIAREQDESVEYVLPKHMLLHIAELLPKEIQGILACCNPVPSIVKTDTTTLHQIIKSARAQPLTEVTLSLNDLSHQEVGPGFLDVTSSLISPHDLSEVEEKHSRLSTLLDAQETLFGSLFDENTASASTALKEKSNLFGNSDTSVTFLKIFMNREATDFMSPFERYKKYLELQANVKEEEGEEENLNEPEVPTDADDERINRIHEHFLSLTHGASDRTVGGNQTYSQDAQDSESVSDLDRLLRLQSHIAMLARETPAGSSVENSNSSNCPSEDELPSPRRDVRDVHTSSSSSDDEELPDFAVKKFSGRKPLKDVLREEYEAKRLEKMKFKTLSKSGKKKSSTETQQAGYEKEQPQVHEEGSKLGDSRMTTRKSSPSKEPSQSIVSGVKRKSSENPEDIRKRLKGTEASDDSTKLRANDVPVDESNLDQQEDGTAIKPYDYGSADYTIFKNKNSKQKNVGKIKENFKAKGSTKPSGKKKSGLKSISWGNFSKKK